MYDTYDGKAVAAWRADVYLLIYRLGTQRTSTYALGSIYYTHTKHICIDKLDTPKTENSPPLPSPPPGPIQHTYTLAHLLNRCLRLVFYRIVILYERIKSTNINRSLD